MRDFNNGRDINVQGDFNVTDNSNNEHKLLANCSSDELLQERPFRMENIQLEQKRKVKRLIPYYGGCLLLFVVAAGLAMLNGKQDLMTIIMGGASLFLGFATLKATLEPNEFQIEEQNAVNEISKLLRQRRVE